FHFGADSVLPTTEWFGIVGARAKTSVPPKVFQQIVKTLAAEYDHASDEYLVDCDASKSAPAIAIQLSSKSKLTPTVKHEYRIPSSAFAANLTKRKDKKCILLFDETDPRLVVGWVLGWNALAGNCWMFDYDAAQFRFAKAKH
ncbi:hypothetical protein AAVH_34879, partial [Aphelenchoides avenae]